MGRVLHTKIRRREARVIYGSRFGGDNHRGSVIVVVQVLGLVVLQVLVQKLRGVYLFTNSVNLSLLLIFRSALTNVLVKGLAQKEQVQFSGDTIAYIPNFLVEVEGIGKWFIK
jgi:hypothetical protein